ncbi:AraC family transcriptional regulator [Pseudonocardia sp. CA-142604]|uniref:AraC family transcriptional regulator n=1 Tax=Pseudonocardia sp. CA-142604 TaxID=3240024 RepID=UPI003D915F10
MSENAPRDLGRAGSPPVVAASASMAQKCFSAFYPARFDILGERRSGAVHRFSRIGPITMGDITYGRDVRLELDELGSSYHVNLPVAGRLESRHRGVEVVATRERAAVYRPDGEVILTRWAADCRQLCVKLDRVAVDRTLEGLLGRPVSGRIAFAAAMDIRSGAARSWAQLLLTLNDQLACSDSIVRQPLVAAPLAEGVVRGLLLAAEHPYSQELSTPAEPCRPSAVRSAIDIMETDPQAPLTTPVLAARCHVSVRTLQEGFQRHVGMSPTTYLRRIRLRRAHEELRAADPSHTTVATVAHKWGFTHLGRFAAAHEGEFGELPGETLRATR